MASKDFQQNKLNFDLSVTIAVGDQPSSAVDLYGTTVVGLITDANLTGTALTFQGSDSLTGTYSTVKLLSTGADISAPVVTTSKYYACGTTIDLSSVRFLKVVSGTIQATNPAVITLATKSTN